MEPVNIDWEELELSCERNGINVDSYLDLETGAVLVFYHESEDEELQIKEIEQNKTRYLPIEPASSREQYKWMEKFVSTVEDEELRKRLLISIDGKGAFRRFKDELVNYPGIRERWYTYRSAHLHNYINGWLAKHDVELDAPPPWGYDVEVPDDTPIPPSTVTTKLSPAEILRRKAKEIIDLVPTNDLPSVIAFMEYLRDRNPAKDSENH